jgi:cell division protein FtsB
MNPMMNPTGQPQLVLQQITDISSLVNQNQMLQNEKTLLTAQLDSLRSDYLGVVKQQIPNLNQQITTQGATIEGLRQENANLRQENDSLKKSIKDLEEKYSKLEGKFDEMQRDFQKICNANRLMRHKMLLGSVAYNFIECAVFYVFKKEDAKKKRKHLRTIQDIESTEKKPDEQQRWDDFKVKFWEDDFDDVLEKFTTNRVDLAHPTTLTEDDEDCPSPKDLQAIVEDLYKAKNSKEIRKNGIALIDKLDLVTRKLGRDLLQF